ncbi:MAG: hypothetical protein NZM15_01135 [Flavobacteriales bacterium]|nr:hypothetical protein [Flavobacteriales bacterium]MDW8431287.1 hypothetical protein [Flavobacteriales bacterium]
MSISRSVRRPGTSRPSDRYTRSPLVHARSGSLPAIASDFSSFCGRAGVVTTTGCSLRNRSTNRSFISTPPVSNT